MNWGRVLSVTGAWLALLAALTGSPATQAADCYRSGQTCVEGPQTRNIQGYEVYRDCWRLRDDYTCISAQSTNDCQTLQNQGCSPLTSTCMERSASGACMLSEQTWQCKVATGATTVITHCGSQQFCQDGRCFDTSHAPDADFAKAVASLEIQREAGRYLDPDTLEVFKGYDNRCRKKLFGLVNCCKGSGGSGGGFSNFSLMAGAAGQVGGAVGSSYMYDALFTSDAPNLVISGFEALFGSGGGSSALAGLMAGNVTVGSFVEALIPGPWGIAMLAIQLSGLLSCEQAEQVLAMKRDHRLCHDLGSYCSKRLPIIRTCVETTQSYCCFNSRLSRILNEQGRAQIGRGWGSPTRPDCGGFTLDQLQTLDFSRMDLSEFFAEIAPTLPNLGELQQRARQNINRSVQPGGGP